MLTLEKLNVLQMKQIYDEDMQVDFPASEIKPFSVMERMMQEGNYECYGAFEDGELAAYAFFSKGRLGEYVLLDYLAVCRRFRSQGYGSRILPLLQENMKQYAGILGEVEDPEFGHDEEDIATRKRRMHYYHSNGFFDTGLYCILFGERLSIICWGKEKAGDDVIYKAMDDIYQVMFTKKEYPGAVSLNYTENI